MEHPCTSAQWRSFACRRQAWLKTCRVKWTFCDVVGDCRLFLTFDDVSAIGIGNCPDKTRQPTTFDDFWCTFVGESGIQHYNFEVFRNKLFTLFCGLSFPVSFSALFLGLPPRQPTTFDDFWCIFVGESGIQDYNFEAFRKKLFTLFCGLSFPVSFSACFLDFRDGCVRVASGNFWRLLTLLDDFRVGCSSSLGPCSCCFFFCSFVLPSCPVAFAEEWQQLVGSVFVVFFLSFLYFCHAACLSGAGTTPLQRVRRSALKA